jgi:adenosylcobinamide kinase/adenosylcobinamide-phosphate guanylyltransferase
LGPVMPNASRLLVLGGARSGKSRYAQARAEGLGVRPIYVATAQAFDEEMRDRITRHRNDRASQWETVDAPLDLSGVIARRSSPDTVLLIDCLTLWATNLILGEHDVSRATDELTSSLAEAPGAIILVANEVGLGIVPDNALARRFRDEAGIINQRVAAAVSEVHFIAAGLPLKLK